MSQNEDQNDNYGYWDNHYGPFSIEATYKNSNSILDFDYFFCDRHGVSEGSDYEYSYDEDPGGGVDPHPIHNDPNQPID